ncbi:PREDICTED: double-headed protease inhibitor, submandibular gland-like [Nicrophorus vespilloides]|uniref:Double-headed protease inhibitor, submandibular gland-like n=1 Tax=Nicrophorus vespilloides TaxID=110193 RepID=A0ABM1MAX2_NICVS|nr:PREDICTED: double-headed protease inhibitor, submandibular gland-like [Nicrophorus vespilloides]
MFSNLIVSLAIVLCVAQCGQCLYKPCTLEWLPICGSDGVTYGNKCLFAQAVKKDSTLTVAFEGSCEEGPRARNAPICTLEWLPICGSDGVTYGNKCFFAQAVKKDSALTVAFEGSCEEGPRARNAPICTLEYFPICGSDGVTYGNQCFFDFAARRDDTLKIVGYGKCKDIKDI